MNRRTFLKSLVTVAIIGVVPSLVTQNAESYTSPIILKNNLDQISIEKYYADVKLLLESYDRELNDRITRMKIVAEIDSLTKLYVDRYIFREYLVVCDKTNNSPKTIGKGRLIVDIYLQGYYTFGYQHTRFTLGGNNYVS